MRRTPDDFDWSKFDATTDEDIARQIAEDPDTAPELDEEDWLANARLVRPLVDAGRRGGVTAPSLPA